MASEIKRWLPSSSAARKSGKCFGKTSLAKRFGLTSATKTQLASEADSLEDLENGEPRIEGSFDDFGYSADCGIDSTKESITDPAERDDGRPFIELVTSVDQMLSLFPPQISQDYCIFRVPKKLRELNDKEYTPQLVSVGPLHRGNPELLGMEEYKARFLNAFLSRSKVTLEICLRLIMGLEGKVRSCYAETIRLSSNEFAKMVLVDSGFIIESVLRYWFDEEEQGVYHFVRLDLILIENQLPFFVLDGIFNLACTDYPWRDDQPHSFLELSVYYLHNILLIQNSPEGISSSKAKHFVDLIRMMHLPSCRRSRLRGKQYIRVQSATELQEAGMKIKCGSSKSFLEMTYNSKGVLEIPRFHVNDSTETVLRNLMALEVYLYRYNSYILDCVFFMDGLIDRAKDVDILVDNGVLENYLGESEAVANIFNKLTSQVLLEDNNYYFCTLSEDLNSYCKVPRHKWKATLKRDYFSSPIKVASVVAATTLLVLTLIQTVCSVISLYR